MTAGVITVGGKRYAVGLFWQVSDTKGLARAAKQAAHQPGSEADYYSLRPGKAKSRVPQFGLGEIKLGHKWNMPSAAVSLANRQPGSWAGVFVVPQGAWFVEVRDDLIAPDGDQLFADEAEAMTRLQEATAHGGLERIYAPPAWAIPGAESSSLPSLLAGRADGRLQPVTIPRKVMLIGLGGLVGVLLVVALVFLILHLRERSQQEEEMRMQMEQQAQQRREEEERTRQEEEARLKAAQEQALSMPQYQRVWETMPKPVDWLLACEEGMTKVPIAPLGWAINSAVCSGSQLSVSWSRTSGPAIIPEGADIDPGLSTATKTIPLATLKQRGREELWPAEAVVTYILYNDLRMDLSYLPDEPPPTGPNGEQLPQPPWKKRRFAMGTSLSPWTLKGPLVDFPGLILQTLTWSPGGTWQMEGVLYEQRKE